MTTTLSNIPTIQIRASLENIDEQGEDKIVELTAAAIEQATRSRNLCRNPEDVYRVAHQLGQEAFVCLKSWAQKTYTVEPDRQLAEAWVEGAYPRFVGATSIQRKIRQILVGS